MKRQPTEGFPPAEDEAWMNAPMGTPTAEDLAGPASDPRSEGGGMNPETLERFLALRKRVMAALTRHFEEDEDGHCKSYEGSMAIHFPNYFDEKGEGLNADAWGVGLDMYVIGPNRHYAWWAPTLDEAVTKADAEISEWISYYEPAAEGSRSPATPDDPAKAAVGGLCELCPHPLSLHTAGGNCHGGINEDLVYPPGVEPCHCVVMGGHFL